MPREDPINEVFDEIDESLRKAYEQLLNEGVPERFVVLIQRLKESRPGEFNDGDMS